MILLKKIATLDSTITRQISLDGGNEIILANWPNDKHIICTINSDIPISNSQPCHMFW